MRAMRSRRSRSRGRGTRDWAPAVAATVYEELPVGVIACGREAPTLCFNRRARELFEGTGEALDADDCAEHYGLCTAEGDRQLRTDEIPVQRALRGEQIRDVVLTVRPRRGSRRLVSVSGGPVTVRVGPQLGAVVVIHDVTARPLAESSPSM